MITKSPRFLSLSFVHSHTFHIHALQLFSSLMPKIRAKISASEAGRLRPQPIKDVEVEDLPIKNRYRPYKRAVARGFVSPSDLESGNSSTTVPVLPIVISSAFVPLLPAPKGMPKSKALTITQFYVLCEFD